ncbi:MAG: hypothetical protein FWD70_02825 [Desulfuromonadales bacterium]|nr:hypothetical protein [Desulfuromonadales bacterium]
MDTSNPMVDASSLGGKILSLIGYVGGIFFLIGVIGALSDPKTFTNSDLVLYLVFLAFFILLILKGSKIKRRIKRFKQYAPLILDQKMTSIDSIAASTSQSVDFVKNDLQKMIDKNFFDNALINTATNEIVIGAAATSTPDAASPPIQGQTAAQSELETFTCPGCGASGEKPKGVPGNCEYCGLAVE